MSQHRHRRNRSVGIANFGETPFVGDLRRIVNPINDSPAPTTRTVTRNGRPSLAETQVTAPSKEV